MNCLICNTAMNVVTRTGNSFTAVDADGNSIDIPDEALKVLRNDSMGLPVTYCCPTGFPISFRKGVGDVYSAIRVGAQHIAGLDHHVQPSSALPGEREPRSPQRVSVDPFNPDVNKRTRLV